MRTLLFLSVIDASTLILQLFFSEHPPPVVGYRTWNRRLAIDTQRWSTIHVSTNKILCHVYSYNVVEITYISLKPPPPPLPPLMVGSHVSQILSPKSLEVNPCNLSR